nr:glycosyltransferase [Ramlibacter cellulosilyticus]
MNPLRPRQFLTAAALVANKLLRFNPRLALERETIALANCIVGRTVWDQAQVAAINPTAKYFHCTHILREAFGQRNWNASECEAASIFVGNGASPRKGAHIAVQGLAILRVHYPHARLYIAGDDPRKSPRWSLRRNVGYPSYLLDLVAKLGLEENVIFTGLLGEQEMAERMCRSHIFLLPSIIENSPNTLAEAMMLGVPCVSAYAGGVASMAADEEDALLYRADDPAMLAFQLKRLLDDPSLAGRLSSAAKKRARSSNDASLSLETQAAIYRKMIARSEG